MLFKKGRKNDKVNNRSLSLPSLSQRITEKDLTEVVFKPVTRMCLGTDSMDLPRPQYA